MYEIFTFKDVKSCVKGPNVNQAIGREKKESLKFLLQNKYNYLVAMSPLDKLANQQKIQHRGLQVELNKGPSYIFGPPSTSGSFFLLGIQLAYLNLRIFYLHTCIFGLENFQSNLKFTSKLPFMIRRLFSPSGFGGNSHIGSDCCLGSFGGSFGCPRGSNNSFLGHSRWQANRSFNLLGSSFEGWSWGDLITGTGDSLQGMLGLGGPLRSMPGQVRRLEIIPQLGHPCQVSEGVTGSQQKFSKKNYYHQMCSNLNSMKNKCTINLNNYYRFNLKLGRPFSYSSRPQKVKMVLCSPWSSIGVHTIFEGAGTWTPIHAKKGCGCQSTPKRGVDVFKEGCQFSGPLSLFPLTIYLVFIFFFESFTL
ncbi:hypothetical protein VP01_54g2 [Puccinia sorghi]|uniref:Uncharacterized protein n=1 Tax=Puccinia sorghi TaxID=27349 RepID=A0A0L6UJE5_9BASI|nr:hypothetical protein VP01_54g2 [Puccinia sorghi]